MKTLVQMIKALADENRLRIALMLKGRELCVCQITAALKLAPSTVSKHISLLEQAGLVETRKKGRWVHCRLPDKPAAEAKRLLECLLAARGGRGVLRHKAGKC
ncbi:MAG: metalloregulator ArsR/SmtB family transcription factor [Elusimicrobiales bacterium]|nr:metalloregulator ArsR/SmtB family transcription factor [Elusimicrobiales bacterium]